MRANQLIVGLREHQVTNLGSCIDCADWLQGLSVPEPDMLICCATTSC
jgi:hypothetical protein